MRFASSPLTGVPVAKPCFEGVPQFAQKRFHNQSVGRIGETINLDRFHSD